MGKKKVGARRVRVRKTESPFAGGLWDFWRDGVTQSFLSSFGRCREQTRLAYIEGWTQRGVSEALEFGNVFHYALADFYHGKPKVPTDKRIAEILHVYREEWERERKVIASTEEEALHKVFALAEPTLRAYVDRWSGDWGDKYKLGCDTVRPKKWLAAESVFRVPYIFPDGRQTFLNGMFDGVFEDARGGIWLLETKTKSRIDEEGISAILPLDRQVNIYLHALREMYGPKVRGVLYNVVRRPGNRLGKTETIAAFAQRIAEDIKKELGSGHYFIRWEMRLSKKESEVWLRECLDKELADVRAWWEGTRPHYMNPDALFTVYGRADMFAPIVHGDYSGHFKRDKAFNELPVSEV